MNNEMIAKNPISIDENKPDLIKQIGKQRTRFMHILIR